MSPLRMPKNYPFASNIFQLLRTAIRSGKDKNQKVLHVKVMKKDWSQAPFMLGTLKKQRPYSLTM